MSERNQSGTARQRGEILVQRGYHVRIQLDELVPRVGRDSIETVSPDFDIVVSSSRPPTRNRCFIDDGEGTRRHDLIIIEIRVAQERTA
jgi:hypothetical protein